MTMTHAILTMGLALFFLIFALRITISGHLRLQYALVWLGIGVLAFASPFLYYLASLLHEKLGFPTASTQLLMGAIFLLYLICLILTRSVSQSQRERMRMAMEIALLEKQINELKAFGAIDEPDKCHGVDPAHCGSDIHHS